MDATIWATAGSLASVRMRLCDAFERGRFLIEIPMHPRMIRIAPLTRPVEHVHFVALLQKQRGPAAASVRRADPIRALPVPAMNQHHGIRMADNARNPMLHVHLHSVAHGSASESGMLHADPVSNSSRRYRAPAPDSRMSPPAREASWEWRQSRRLRGLPDRAVLFRSSYRCS